MKYRRLEAAQLEELEKEFIDFLVVNGIVADDWVKLKEEETDKAQAIIDQFSDSIWEGVLRKAKYMEKYTPSSIYCFKCDEKEMALIKINDHRAIADLTNESYRKTALDGSMHITIQKANKAYTEVRELEIFKLLESGCVITNGSIYEQLA